MPCDVMVDSMSKSLTKSGYYSKVRDLSAPNSLERNLPLGKNIA